MDSQDDHHLVDFLIIHVVIKDDRMEDAMSIRKNVPTLYTSIADCCGCGSCASSCPLNAIAMVEDSFGFVFPRINDKICIGCGACVRACGFHERLGRETLGPWYAAVGKGDVSASASGGVFVSLAQTIISEGGCVFGAAYKSSDGSLSLRHCLVDSDRDLAALLNSKYVQSDAGCCFEDVQEQLRAQRIVLFSGTPCQVAGLKGYLVHDWPNLYTADLVCHGVPSEALFQSWLSAIEDKYGSSVVDVYFRCKRNGWDHSLLLLFILLDGREILLPAEESAYYDLFLKLKTLRKSCYSCPYGGKFRAGDITMGDFWGVDITRPEVFTQEGFNKFNGVSCLLVNNEHGALLLEKYGGTIRRYQVNYDEIASGNDQLRHPSIEPSDRDIYLDAFSFGGWNLVEKTWRKKERGGAYVAKIVAKTIVPKKLQNIIKGFIGHK